MPVVQVSFDPQNTEFFLHDSATFLCHFMSVTNVTRVEWLSESTNISGKVADYKIDTKIDEKLSTLTVKKVTPERMGQYDCKVTNQDGESVSGIYLDLKEGE